MNSAILAKEVLKLSPTKRAQIIDLLWQSLDPAEQTAVDNAWLEESKDRLKAYREGQLKAIDGDKTLRSIESNLGR